MKRVVLCLLSVSALGVSCGDGGKPDLVDNSPYEDVPATATVTVDGLGGPIDIVRDEYGVAHVYADAMDDVAFGSGYVMAADRLAQMNMFRHVAEGRIAELFGALDQGQVDADIQQRMHRLLPKAQAELAQLTQSTDPTDQAMLRFLLRFTAGVNAVLAEYAAGTRVPDPSVSIFFDPTRVTPWLPEDSLAIGFFQAQALSYDNGAELYFTDVYQAAAATFDAADPMTQPDRARRAGAGFDLWPVRPMDHTSTIDGFPNVTNDSGTRAKPAGATPGSHAPPAARRPRVPHDLLAAAIRSTTPPTALAHAFHRHDNGSNNWAVASTLTGGAGAILANDPHLRLYSPSIFYPYHLTVPGQLDVAGITFPGIPGVILGHNAHLAWGGTVTNHDVSDFYLETIGPCAAGGGDCVSWKGQEVPLETFTEEIKVGALGTVTDTVTVTYEVVPHHGPILPNIVDHRAVPRTGAQALSVRYTGFEVTHELRALYRLDRASTVQEGIDALDDFGFGSQNWMFADDTGNIGWSTRALVPLRTDGCYTWDPTSAPDGVTPFFVVPGDGSCEWDGWMSDRYIPHALTPASGFLATANADPIGETFDGNPLNGPIADDGHRLYLSAFGLDPGYRIGRITRRLEAAKAAGAITLDDMASVQGDGFSSMGNTMRPFLVDAVAKLAAEIATPGVHPELATFAASLSPERRARLMDAGARLTAWSLETPAALRGTPAPAEIDDSVATSIFNMFMSYWLEDAFADELAAMGYSGIDSDFTARAGLAALARPAETKTGVAVETGEALLCDDLATAAVVEGCTLQLVRALDQALAFAQTTFGSADMTTWRWGKLHTVTLGSLLPARELDVPPYDDPDPTLRAGFPRHGDQFSVDASSPGYRRSFSYGHGPAMRHLTQFTAPGTPVTRLAIPGGTIFERASPHWRDLFDAYWSKNEYFEVPWSTAQILGAAESRWRLTPR